MIAALAREICDAMTREWLANGPKPSPFNTMGLKGFLRGFQFAGDLLQRLAAFFVQNIPKSLSMALSIWIGAQ